MNLKFLLGVATGVGVTLFLTSERGQQLLEGLGQRVSDGLSKSQEALDAASENLENVRRKVVETTSSNSRPTVMS